MNLSPQQKQLLKSEANFIKLSKELPEGHWLQARLQLRAKELRQMLTTGEKK